MRCLKYFVIFVLLLGIFAGISVSASETETDWSTVDWATFDWSQVDWYAIDYNQVDWEKADIKAMIRAMYTGLYEDTEGKRLSRFWDWVENEASLELLIEISLSTDGASSESACGLLYDRFERDPYAVVQAIAREQDEYRHKVLIGHVVYGAYPTEPMKQILSSYELPETATDAERAVWTEIIREAERQWNVVLTEDWIGVPMILLLVSTAGLALLVSKKRMLVK